MQGGERAGIYGLERSGADSQTMGEPTTTLGRSLPRPSGSLPSFALRLLDSVLSDLVAASRTKLISSAATAIIHR